MDKIINVVDGHDARNKVLSWVASIDSSGAFRLYCNGHGILSVPTDGEAIFNSCNLTEYGITTAIVGKDNTIIHGG